MLEFPTWKKVSLWLIALIGVLAAIPSIFSLTNQAWPEQLPDPTVNLGLDLAGGSHILLEAEPSQVEAKRLEDLEESVRNAMRRAEPRIRIGDVSTADGTLSFLLDDAGDIDRARGEIEGLINGVGPVRDWDFSVVDGQRFVLTPTQAGLDTAISDAMDAALRVINDRIDSLGTREPTVIRQGETRIVVQVPGLQDPEALKELIGKTAQLEFKRVLRDATLEEVSRGFVSGGEVYPYASEEGGPPVGGVVVERLGGIDGSTLTNAKEGVDQQTNESIVNIAFNPEGSRQFSILTTKYLGERFAIILDDEVISAPTMQARILNGQSQISGSFTPASARDLAIQLSSGALPVDLSVVEERTVGPDLGADSVRQGLLAMAVGTLLVMLLMIVTYGRFGIFATVALVINVLMLLGIMAALGATLTLPGIAGFVLTIGAAVDANVLINERIREERKRGRRVIAAVENGYKEASRAIYDANITNFIAGALLFNFGSGPIKGFAVVLVVGLFTSVFTAVTLTRMWVAAWLRDKRPNDIRI